MLLCCDGTDDVLQKFMLHGAGFSKAVHLTGEKKGRSVGPRFFATYLNPSFGLKISTSVQETGDNLAVLFPGLRKKYHCCKK